MQLKPLRPGKLQDWMAVEVNQTFVDIFRRPLLACFNHSYINCRLSDTHQECLISLLLKQDTSGKYKRSSPFKKLEAPYSSVLCCKNSSKM